MRKSDIKEVWYNLKELIKAILNLIVLIISAPPLILYYTIKDLMD